MGVIVVGRSVLPWGKMKQETHDCPKLHSDAHSMLIVILCNMGVALLAGGVARMKMLRGHCLGPLLKEPPCASADAAKHPRYSRKAWKLFS